jgi:hypothetical protein
MITPRILAELAAIVGDANIVCAETLLHAYEYDAYMLESARPDAVVFVCSVEEVASVAKVAQRASIPLIPRGSGTNLSGGTLAVRGGIVIELARMNRVLEIDVPNRTVLVEAGVFNADVSVAINDLGFYYAPDPASGKACTIGGNIAEGAGGPHSFKYGVTANRVLGAEVVLPDGEVVWLGGKGCDALGYDVLGLFIGSEGTLGDRTAVDGAVGEVHRFEVGEANTVRHLCLDDDLGRVALGSSAGLDDREALALSPIDQRELEAVASEACDGSSDRVPGVDHHVLRAIERAGRVDRDRRLREHLVPSHVAFPQDATDASLFDRVASRDLAVETHPDRDAPRGSPVHVELRYRPRCGDSREPPTDSTVAGPVELKDVGGVGLVGTLHALHRPVVSREVLVPGRRVVGECVLVQTILVAHLIPHARGVLASEPPLLGAVVLRLNGASPPKVVKGCPVPRRVRAEVVRVVG